MTGRVDDDATTAAAAPAASWGGSDDIRRGLCPSCGAQLYEMRSKVGLWRVPVALSDSTHALRGGKCSNCDFQWVPPGSDDSGDGVPDVPGYYERMCEWIKGHTVVAAALCAIVAAAVCTGVIMATVVAGRTDGMSMGKPTDTDGPDTGALTNSLTAVPTLSEITAQPGPHTGLPSSLPLSSRPTLRPTNPPTEEMHPSTAHMPTYEPTRRSMTNVPSYKPTGHSVTHIPTYEPTGHPPSNSPTDLPSNIPTDSPMFYEPIQTFRANLTAYGNPVPIFEVPNADPVTTSSTGNATFHLISSGLHFNLFLDDRDGVGLLGGEKGAVLCCDLGSRGKAFVATLVHPVPGGLTVPGKRFSGTLLDNDIAPSFCGITIDQLVDHIHWHKIFILVDSTRSHDENIDGEIAGWVYAV